jgi:hypothetical protein
MTPFSEVLWEGEVDAVICDIHSRIADEDFYRETVGFVEDGWSPDPPHERLTRSGLKAWKLSCLTPAPDRQDTSRHAPARDRTRTIHPSR